MAGHNAKKINSNIECKSKLSYLNNEMKKVVLKIVILKIIKKHKIHPYAIIKILSNFQHLNYFISDKSELKNDVYNIISTLQKGGYIKLNKKHKKMNFYMLTKKGDDTLLEINRNFKEIFIRLKNIMK
ncbi:MAG: helix-turn-helix transcriptional regulator [Candidatus Marsarchaeota archaeon]|jgi:DNA-binding PadR family transcriptional regulator|nr:helix-turn-helix transcriptional regulator [Candidatus Marsarchaeota archaeon]